MRDESIEEQARRLGRIAGWAPGNYTNRCSCGVYFTGAKQAIHCLPCAVGKAEAAARADERGKCAEIARGHGFSTTKIMLGVVPDALKREAEAIANAIEARVETETKGGGADS